VIVRSDLCIYAGDIERKKIRADFGITYDADALKLIDDLAERGIRVVVSSLPLREPALAMLFKTSSSDAGYESIRIASPRAIRRTWTPS